MYATITYYPHNRAAVSASLEDWLEHGERVREEQERNPPPVVVKLRAVALLGREELTEQELRQAHVAEE